MSRVAFLIGVPVLVAFCVGCSGVPPKKPQAPTLRQAQHEGPSKAEQNLPPHRQPLDAVPFHSAPPPAYGNKVVLAEAENGEWAL